MSHDPIHAGTSEDAGLDPDLVRMTLMNAPPNPGVFAFRVLPYEEHVYISRRAILQRCRNPRK